jgi:hypothetical protein
VSQFAYALYDITFVVFYIFMTVHEFGSPADMHAAIQNSKERILEIGVGIELPEHIYRGSVHVGLNIDPRQHATYIEEVVEKAVVNPLAQRSLFGVIFDLRRFGTGDIDPENSDYAHLRDELTELLGDTAFDCLMFKNVFGEVDSNLHYPTTPELNPTGDDYRGSSDLRNKYNALQVATSFLKAGGLLVIRETMTPGDDYAKKLATTPRTFLKPLGYGNIDLRFNGSGEVDRSTQAFSVTAVKRGPS